MIRKEDTFKNYINYYIFIMKKRIKEGVQLILILLTALSAGFLILDGLSISNGSFKIQSILALISGTALIIISFIISAMKWGD